MLLSSAVCQKHGSRSFSIISQSLPSLNSPFLSNKKKKEKRKKKKENLKMGKIYLM